jgi:RecA-family ATPase
MRPNAAELEAAALRQPGAVRRQHGIKFQCPKCAADGHDAHRDNACLFNNGDWGCAWSKDTALGRAHWDAIGRALGAFSNGHAHGAQAAPPPSGDGLDLVPLGVLLGEPAEVYAWVVKERLPAGGLGLLAGKPKAGKSTAARCLALAVARGAPWLGFATTPGSVIYLALEEKRAEVREHFRSLGATAEDQILLLCASAPLDALERLRREAERRRPVLIIIDPLFRFVRVDDGNDYATMTAALEPLLVLARETGACVLLVHHLGKGERNDGDNVLGSTAIFGAVDSALLMKRTDKYRTLSSIQRYGEDLEEITIMLDTDTRDVSAGTSRAQAEQDEAARLILTFLKTAPAPVTEAELDASIEGRTQPRRAALRALVKQGEVERSGRGGKADPFRYAGTRTAAGASI